VTITELPLTAALAPVTHDLYRDIHKAIRVELFSVTTTAASLDPSDPEARAALAGHVADIAALLSDHAEHEDGAIQPVLERELPQLAAEVESDHASLECRIASLRDEAAEAALPRIGDPGFAVHRLHLDLAAFTSKYLAHQDLEERVIMPALEDRVGVEAVVAVHQAILGSIPPDAMAKSLAIMLPAMNIDGRSELLGGMRAGAPAEVFEGVWGLAGSVLAPEDRVALARRLDLP
jgi:iron-sulfur cluster repair protein YtfE (RIC family)